MKQPPIESNRDADGARHEIVVREMADGGWRVLDRDVEAETARVIETLTDGEDGRSQAEAIARDYMTTLTTTTTSAGRTPRDPIPEQRGPDARHHPRPRPGSRQHPARGTALPRPTG